MLDLLPEAALSIGLATRAPAIIRYAFAILVSEQALGMAGNSHLDPRHVPVTTVLGRNKEMLDLGDVTRSAIENGATAFLDRVHGIVQDLLDPKARWLSESAEYRKLDEYRGFLTAHPELELQRDTVDLVQQEVREYIQSEVTKCLFADATRLELGSPHRLYDSKLLAPFDNLNTVHENLNYDQRPLTRLRWQRLLNSLPTSVDVRGSLKLTMPCIPGSDSDIFASLRSFQHVKWERRWKTIDSVVLKLNEYLQAAASRQRYTCGITKIEAASPTETEADHDKPRNKKRASIRNLYGSVQDVLRRKHTDCGDQADDKTFRITSYPCGDTTEDTGAPRDVSGSVRNVAAPTDVSEPTKNLVDTGAPKCVSTKTLVDTAIPIQGLPIRLSNTLLTDPPPSYDSDAETEVAEMIVNHVSLDHDISGSPSRKLKDEECSSPRDDFKDDFLKVPKSDFDPWTSDEPWNDLQKPNSNYGYTSNPPDYNFNVGKCLSELMRHVRRVAERMLDTPIPLIDTKGILADTVFALDDNEFKYLPLFAGGLNDGSGGVVEREIPAVDASARNLGPGSIISVHAQSEYAWGHGSKNGSVIKARSEMADSMSVDGRTKTHTDDTFSVIADPIDCLDDTESIATPVQSPTLTASPSADSSDDFEMVATPKTTSTVRSLIDVTEDLDLNATTHARDRDSKEQTRNGSQIQDQHLLWENGDARVDVDDEDDDMACFEEEEEAFEWDG